MTVLFDCAHRPVCVQLVLPLQTSIGLPFLSRRTANLLCPMCAELLNIRFCNRLPISAASFSRASWLVVSQMISFLGLPVAPLAAFADFLATFLAAFLVAAFLVFFATFLAASAILDRLTMDFAAAAIALAFFAFLAFFAGAPFLGAFAGPLPAVERIRLSRD